MKKTRVVLVGYGAMGKNVEELLRGKMCIRDRDWGH